MVSTIIARNRFERYQQLLKGATDDVEARKVQTTRNETHINEIRASIRDIIERELTISRSKSTFEDQIQDIYTDSESAKRIDIEVNLLMQITQEELSECLETCNSKDEETIMQQMKPILKNWGINKVLDSTSKALGRFFCKVGKGEWEKAMDDPEYLGDKFNKWLPK